MLNYSESYLPLLKIWQRLKNKYNNKYTNKLDSDTYKKSLLKTSYNNLLDIHKIKYKVNRSKTY